MPAAMSATEMPTFAGASSLPVIDTQPDLALDQQVVGLLVAYGPTMP